MSDTRFMYASDLDRTLIFSTAFLKDFPTDKEMVEVEKCNEDFYSYMDKEGLAALKTLSEAYLFVPVTSRTTAQYERIRFGFVPEYAITSMGGVILHNGKPLEEWSEAMRSSINWKEKEDIEKVLSHYGERLRWLDESFFFIKDEDGSDIMGMENFFPNWRFVKQGKKHYIIPPCISKLAAMNCLKEKLGCEYVVASGDSSLDMDILSAADLAIVPDSAYIAKEALEKGFLLSEGAAESSADTIRLVRNAFQQKETV